MARRELSHADQALRAFLQGFEFTPDPRSSGRAGWTSNNEPEKLPWAAALNTRHPMYAEVGKQVDAAAALVRKVEEYLNRPGTFCIPVHSDIGPLQYFPPGEFEDRTSVGGPHREVDFSSQYALGIVRVHDKWRVAVYRWTIYGLERSDRRGRSRPSRKPWLEASYMDKAVTLSHLPKVIEKLFKNVSLMARTATSNDRGLAVLGEIVAKIPTA